MAPPQWAPGAGEDISDSATRRLREQCVPPCLVAEMRPLDAGAFSEAIRRTRGSSSGPDGLPDSVWTATGDSGCRVLYQAYLDLLRGVLTPSDIKRSLVVHTPKELDYSTCGIPSAAPGPAGPISLSTTCHELLAKAINATLEQVAEIVEHLVQRGFVPGRGRMTNVFEGLAPMYTASLLKGTGPMTVLFDIRFAFPGVSWQWMWRVLQAISAPDGRIAAATIRLLCEGSYSDITLARGGHLGAVRIVDSLRRRCCGPHQHYYWARPAPGGLRARSC